MDARCQCGLVMFTTPLPEPVETYICHCTECRHQASSAFGITCTFPSFDLATALKPSSSASSIKCYTRRTFEGKDKKCYFCVSCGSRLMHVNEGGQSCSVKGGCIEGLRSEWLAKAKHIWVQDAVVPREWFQGSAGVWEREPDEGTTASN